MLHGIQLRKFQCEGHRWTRDLDDLWIEQFYSSCKPRRLADAGELNSPWNNRGQYRKTTFFYQRASASLKATISCLDENQTRYFWFFSQNPCDKSLCQHSSTCQAGFTDKGYRCLCGSGFCGEHCETGTCLGFMLLSVIFSPLWLLVKNHTTFSSNQVESNPVVTCSLAFPCFAPAAFVCFVLWLAQLIVCFYW